MDTDRNKEKVNIQKSRYQSRSARRHLFAKRIISLVLSFAMLLATIGVYDLLGISSDFGIAIVAHAAGGKYDVADYTTDQTIDIDGVSHPYYELTSLAALTLYSQAYYEYAHTEGSEHKNDVIKIDLGQGTVTEALSGFESIGNDEAPFAGRIYFGESSYTKLNLNCPFFGTVKDSVQVYVSNTTTPMAVTVTRIDDAIDEPLFARKVIHDSSASTFASWSVTADQYTDGTNFDTYPFAGFIGEMDANTQLTLTAVNNAVKSNGSAQIHSASNNIGLLCQTMGAGASLTATYSGTNTSFAISTASGNAGGLVGQMAAGSHLTVTMSGNPQSAGEAISTASGYAGGIVGYNDGGTITLNISGSSPVTINQAISGTAAAGAIYGYFRPVFTSNAAEFDINGYNLSGAVLEATGSVGGLFGVLENAAVNSTEDTITIKTTGETDTVSPTNGTAGHTNYGGLIGKYTANETNDTLIITDLKANITNNVSVNAIVTNYGGAIGCVDTGSYVYINNFELSGATNIAAANTTNFGGLVAKAEGAYIYVNGATIGTAETELTGFDGGGLVGSLGDGVLGMTGTINLSNAKPTAAATNGQIVGSRDNALVYAENLAAPGSTPASTWTYSPSSIEVDNIGSWGDVVFFDRTTLAKGDVIASETNHVITFNTANPSDIDSVADYAIVSLLFQIDPSKNSFLTGTQLATNVDLTFSGDITLTGTGLRGITRDNGSRVKYYGAITGGSKTVTLDIKNIGVTDRPVYYHMYNGLLGCASSVTVENLYLDGNIQVKPKTNDRFIGAFAAVSEGTLNASGCKTLSTLNISITNSSSYTAGRFIGLAEKKSVDNKSVCAGMNTISISGCEFAGTISGDGDRSIGGVFGTLGVADSVTPDWTFNNVSLKGTVSGVKSVGGLAAEVSGGNRATIKLVGTTGVVADGITVSGSDSSMGGLFGYNWLNTDVEVTKVSVANAPTVRYSGTGGTAGLVYCATGHWTVTDLNLSGIKMSTSKAKNIGMIVNKGTNGSGSSKSGIYLELPSGYSYSLSFTSDSDLTKATVFDELCAYSADSAANIMNNKQGIVSISTAGLKMETTAEDSLSYQNQTPQGETANPNTRYYYNLDLIDTNTTGARKYSDLSSASAKLMRWGAYCYAADNIKKNFQVDQNDKFSFSASDNYDMKGYSWYPINLESAITVAGTFKFYNKEFTDCEGQKSTENKWLPNTTPSTNQHYMMQNGLFYNVTKSLTVGAVVLQGNIGATGTSGTGALVYGTVTGSSANQDGITVVSSVNGSVSLDGIKVWNFKGTDGASPDYAPLLINKTGSYVTLNISNVSTTSTYAAAEEAATSLIGKAGQTSTTEGVTTTDTYVTVSFSKIKLDARKTASTPALTSHGYNTTKSIFTRATLLESMVNESGDYTYTYADDWTDGHKVTYGEEVGYTTSSKPTSQYPDQEQWYYRTSTSETKLATQYSSAPTGDSTSDSFGGFLPYVKTVSTADEISAGTGTYYQLKVNHQPSEVIQGCGTYNDPYIIKTEADFVKISKWIGGNDLGNATINYLLNDTWCDGKTEHATQTGFTDSTTPSKTTIRQYLAGAYYIIDPAVGNNITIESANFTGLGTKDSGFRFRGVIVGGNNISVTNKTYYPLIAYSDGCVVKNLTVIADSSGLYSGNSTYGGKIVVKGQQKTTYDGYSVPATGNDVNKPNAYGAVIGQIVGGDNIIDNVQVNLSNLKIYLEGYSQYAPIGGYVGVIINGGLVFRNMSGTISGLSNNSNITCASDSNLSSTTNLLNSDNYTWLYVNPIIGRVINGFAVTESDSYKPREANATMKNSTGDHTAVKNYSITDIKKYSALTSTDKLSVSSSKEITIPDSQSFFLMSLMVNSGMSVQQTYKSGSALGTTLGYYTGFCTTRHAVYDKVGDVTDSSYSDYVTSTKDIYSVTDKTKYIPNLIYNYTNSTTIDSVEYYLAKQISNSNNIYTVELATNGSYDLSDGYRGIGNFFKSDNHLRLNVSLFDGKGSTINQNTSYYYYGQKNSATVDDCSDDYRPYNDLSAGIGLFNCLNTSSTFKNFILSGNVQCDAYLRQIDTTNKVSTGENRQSGTHIYYKSSFTNANRQMSAAMLFPAVLAKCNIDLDSIALQNVNVRGVRYSGGIIGNLAMDKNNATNIKLTNTKKIPSYGITVNGAGTTGGMIAWSYNGKVEINNENATYSINEIVSECEKQDKTSEDYNYGIGGFIGIARVGPVTIENVTVGTENQETATYVKCENAEINAGGLVGILNRPTFTIKNCKIYNQSVISQYTASGLIGYYATPSGDSVISNVKIYCRDELGCEITSKSNKRFAGGFIGAAKRDANKVTIEDSSISGYAITGNDAGGIVGFFGHFSVDNQNKNSILITNNVVISNCTISAGTNAGGVVGYLNRDETNTTGSGESLKNTKKEYYGYNVLENNVIIIDATNKGCICGGTMLQDYNIIKVVGFSRQETLGEGDTSSMVQDFVGRGSLGTGGYVVFADYNGDCLGTAGTDYSNAFSTVNNSSNVTVTYTDAESNVVNFPYVTSSSPTNIGASKFLTGDGVSNDAYTNIAADITESANGRYSLAENNLVTQAGYITDFASANAQIVAHLSTYQVEMGDSALPGIDFPLLVVDDVTRRNTTALVNDYIRLLTNTTYTYNYNVGNNSNSDIFDTVLCKCTYSADGTSLTIDDSESCLKMNGSYFYMTANDTDTAATAAGTPQFSLIDVQFKDPSDTTKIAYHLYVPVYVRKLLEYDFDIRLESGTDYVPAAALEANTLLENLGVPVTAEFNYTYDRTLSEWQAAVDGGDSLLSNYPKKLLFTNSSLTKDGTRAGFEARNAYYDAHTKMVLIDTQNGSKAYYCNSLTGSAFTETTTDNWTLDLQQFSDSSGTAFAPVPFNDLMTVTATQSSTGKFVCLGDAGVTGTAAVRDNSGGALDGKTFRLKEDGDSSSAPLYNITLSNADSVSEHYFLSIFTVADYSVDEHGDPVYDIPVYHYAISSPKTLGILPYPSRAVDGDTAHLLTGNIYENSLTITPKSNETDMYHADHKYGNDYIIEATLTATVGISADARTIVDTYLSRVSTIEIYQSFLTTLNMRDGGSSDRGIKALKDTAVANYKVGGAPVTAEKSANSNFAEFKNNVNLRQGLSTGSVTITADVTLIFDDEDIVGGDSEDAPAQFYPGPISGRGTTLIAYSNIASNQDKTGYSKVSKEVEDTDRLYYYNSTESVEFEYNAYADNELGLYGQLGINANDLDVNPVPITTLGTYDISKFQSSAATADYLRLEVELLTIDNAYDLSATCNISDYLSNFSILTSASPTFSDTSNARKWVFMYPKSAFAIESQTYQIPISYSVYTGNTPAFEQSSRKYSNYEVKITASMWSYGGEGEETYVYVPNSENSDFIKYTNARIYIERVNPNKAEPQP